MTLARDTLLFFDASCLIAAAGSPRGGSAFLLEVCQAGFLRACSSLLVLLEAERNICAKLPPAALIRYRLLLASTPVDTRPSPPRRTVQQYEPVFGEDAHVVASALAVEASYLLTLDRRLIRALERASLSISALPPGDFIQAVLPTHPDFAAIR